MKIKYLYFAVFLFSLIFSCVAQSEFNVKSNTEAVLLGDQIKDTIRNEELYLHADSIFDTERADSEFDFKTILPVKLKIKVDLYNIKGQDVAAMALRGETVDVDDKLRDDVRAIIMLISAPLDDQGNDTMLPSDDRNRKPVFIGMTDAEGLLETTLQLPAELKTMVLSIIKPGFETRTVNITDMVKYSEVNRTMAMATTNESSSTRQADISDRDGDYVPDIYDAFPDDPLRAFTLSFPPEGYEDYHVGKEAFFTVAFEDNFPSLGDGDYDV